jgi:hypothetical protein
MTLPLPMALQKALRHNEFWSTIRKELPRLGYNQFAPVAKGDHFQVIIECMEIATHQSRQVVYDFPRFARKFSTAFNFKSQLKNFIMTHMLDHGLCPINSDTGHRVRQPGMFTLKQPYNTQPERVPLQISPPIIEHAPQPMTAEVEDVPTISDQLEPSSSLLQYASLPIDTSQLQETDMTKKDDMVMLTLGVRRSDVGTVLDVTSGVAKFITASGMHVLPTDIPSDNQIMQVPTKISKDKIREMTGAKKKKAYRPRGELISKVIELMQTNPTAGWYPADMRRFTRETKAIANAMGRAVTAKLLKKTQIRGEYKLTAVGRSYNVPKVSKEA